MASTTSSISGADITVSGTINGDAVSQSNILTTDTPSGTVEIVISAPDIVTLDLGQISITFEGLIGYDVTLNIGSLEDLGDDSIYYIVNGQQRYKITTSDTTITLNNVASLLIGIGDTGTDYTYLTVTMDASSGGTNYLYKHTAQLTYEYNIENNETISLTFSRSREHQGGGSLG